MLPTSLKDLWATDRARAIAILAILAMVTANQSGTGVLSVVIPVTLAAQGYTASAVGAISTTFSICFLIGCLIGPDIARRLGPQRTPFIVAGVNATLAVLHWLLPGAVTWAMLRGVGGISTAIYFVLVETWLSAISTQNTRGLIFGAYMVLNRLAFALGQIVIAFVPLKDAPLLFLAAAAAYLVAPLARPRTAVAMPGMSGASLSGFLELPRLAPAAAAASLVHGLVFGSIPGLLPKWGIDFALSLSVIGQGLAAIQIGGMVLQMPISYCADRFDRRIVMAIASLATALTSVFMLWVPAEPGLGWLLLLLLWGGCASTLYSLAAAHAGDMAPPHKRVIWVSSLMFVWGAGAAIGPLLAAALMDGFGSSMLWSYAATMSLVAAAYLIWRRVVRP